MSKRVYIQSELLPEIRLIEVDETVDGARLKALCIAELPSESREDEVFLFQEDGTEELHASVKVVDIFTEQGGHVHLHRCRHIKVSVRFSGRTIEHEFQPGTTVGKVKKWAVKEFGMPPADAAEHVLQILGTSDQPDVATHIGTLAPFPKCAVAFDLVPSHRIQG